MLRHVAAIGYLLVIQARVLTKSFRFNCLIIELLLQFKSCNIIKLWQLLVQYNKRLYTVSQTGPLFYNL